jgi:UDP-N-acetylmuramate--alanine ligase
VRERPERLVLVDVAAQRLVRIEGGQVVAEFPVSTAATGIGGELGSFCTPPGWHRVRRRIGEGAAPGTVFVGREPTGEVWAGETRDDDLILTRILTLDGQEDGVNRGPGCDSLERHVYLHGTNREDELGRPTSHGCVRLSSADMVEVFDAVLEGDWVAIAVASPAYRVG